MTGEADAGDGDIDIRPYDPARDDRALWALKTGFERGIGAGTGGDEKESAYKAKLTDDYRERWLAWVERCVDEDPGCVVVADASAADTESDRTSEGRSLVGYAFVLPDSLSFVWDAAVLNEIHLAPASRGTGVADDLFEAALACARGQDLPLDRMVLDVDRENERARAFYERYGFEHWGEMVARGL
ncbi:GNAT family N-acetyltransferase [Halobellus sp. EA9]|uniref:GNAT family N-acetyltransferase n=1 Tax=Halobellus sp. EA9 TaxID=3421647 RepID=UPI003EBEF2AE